MDIAAFEALLTPEGQEILAKAARSDTSETGLLATTASLRKRHAADLVAAALIQVRLRTRAHAKFGDDADRMYFTPDGLEQSTRAAVAAYRAARFVTSAPVLELGCGIGADLIARARAGVPGVGIERDPLTAAVARANIKALGLEKLATVQVGDAVEADPEGFAAVFADPGRRTARGRVFDPRAYEPPLDTVLDIAKRAPGGCVKVAPGIPYEAIPAGAEAEWISVSGEVKEAALWLGALAGGVHRRATLLGPRGEIATLAPEKEPPAPAVREWGRYLYEPDGAVIRAHLVAAVAAAVNGGLADPNIAYVTGDDLVPTPFASAYEIDEVLPFSGKGLRARLRARGAGRVTLKKRGSAVDLDRLRRDLSPAIKRAGKGGPELTVLLTRVGAAPVAVLARPVRHGKIF